MGQETITAYIRPSNNPTGMGYHTWLIYTNSAGQSFSLSGWPTGQGSILAPFGSIDAQVVPWGPKSWDWTGNNNFTASELIASGTSLSSAWNTIVQTAQQVDFANIPYNPLTLNSNSLINTVLLAAGLPPVSIDSAANLLGLWTPGSATDLRIIDLSKKYAPDEINVFHGALQFHQHMFGYGGTGDIFRAGAIDPFSGPPVYLGGHWQQVSIQVQGFPASSGWVWVEANSRMRATPVVLDLAGNGLHLVDATAAPGFDFFGTGHKQALGWTGQDAFLFLDADGNGTVTDGSELSFLHHLLTAQTDLAALAAFDTNADGVLSAADTGFASFRVWTDADMNGVSDPGETMTLVQAGVASIGLASSGSPYAVGRNSVYGTSVVTLTNGAISSAYDVGLDAHPKGSVLLTAGAQWTTLRTDAGEIVSVQTDHALTSVISDAFSFSINGYASTGFQLGAGNDQVYSGNQQDSRSIYVDAGDGNNTLYFSSSTAGSVLKTGSGDDVIRGTLGSDFIFPGSGQAAIVDLFGDDTYVVVRNSTVSVTDCYGFDVMMLQAYRFQDIQFSVAANTKSVLITANDGTLHVTIENMRLSGSSDYVVEYFTFADRTVTGQSVLDQLGYYTPPSGGGGGGGGGGPVLNRGGSHAAAADRGGVDLSGDVADLVALQAPDTFLMMDKNRGGTLDLRAERVLGAAGNQADNAALVMALLDTDGDGRLTEYDREYETLYGWFDANQNHIVDDGETFNLIQAGSFATDLKVTHAQEAAVAVGQWTPSLWSSPLGSEQTFIC